ncbi:MAG: SCO family protein [Chloroflexota bacterium]|nr:SCO family protein [Dehalococcoidia bacterium]MDW8255014.1 SCO family protein [Chloroflexota bacterium]
MKRLVALSVVSTVAFVLVVAGAVTILLTSQRKAVTASLITPPLPAADFTLRDTSGQLVALSSLRGKPVLLTFGYTSCPDVCPITLAKLAYAKSQLGARGRDLHVIFVTVDPERDRPDVVRAYLDRYDRSFIGLIPTAEELEQVAKLYHLVYEKEPASEALGYIINHTAATIVIDREGLVRMLFWPEMTPDEMASDLRTVLGL